MEGEIGCERDWMYVFNQHHQNLVSLNSYAEINELATKKIAKKFFKDFFAEEPKVLKADLLSFIDKRQFCNRKVLEEIIENFNTFYVVTLAKEKEQNQMHWSENIQIGFFAGVIVSLMTLSFYLQPD